MLNPVLITRTSGKLAFLVFLLASEKSSYMTEATTQVDGGLLRGLF